MVEDDPVVSLRAQDHGDARARVGEPLHTSGVDACLVQRIHERGSEDILSDSTEHEGRRSCLRGSDCLVCALAARIRAEAFARKRLSLLRHALCRNREVHIEAAKDDDRVHCALLPAGCQPENYQ